MQAIIKGNLILCALKTVSSTVILGNQDNDNKTANVYKKTEVMMQVIVMMSDIVSILEQCVFPEKKSGPQWE